MAGAPGACGVTGPLAGAAGSWTGTGIAAVAGGATVSAGATVGGKATSPILAVALAVVAGEEPVATTTVWTWVGATVALEGGAPAAAAIDDAGGDATDDAAGELMVAPAPEPPAGPEEVEPGAGWLGAPLVDPLPPAAAGEVPGSEGVPACGGGALAEPADPEGGDVLALFAADPDWLLELEASPVPFEAPAPELAEPVVAVPEDPDEPEGAGVVPEPEPELEGPPFEPDGAEDEEGSLARPGAGAASLERAGAGDCCAP